MLRGDRKRGSLFRKLKMTDLNRQIQEIAKIVQAQEQEKYKKDIVEFYTSIISKSYDKASTYSNLIIVAGYALFFTFWANIKNEVNLIDARVSAIYVILSVLCFLLWEIGVMLYSAKNLKNLQSLKNVPPDKFKEQMQKIIKKNEESEAAITRYWVYELIMTLFCGFAGVIVLMIAYVKTIFS